MNLAGDPSSLSQHRCKSFLHPTHAQAIQQRPHNSKSEHAGCVEPIRLIEKRLQIQTECGAGFVPNAIVVAGNHPKAVIPGAQISVISNAPRAAVNPILVEAFQFVLKLYFLGSDKAWRGEVEVEASSTRRQFNALTGRD